MPRKIPYKYKKPEKFLVFHEDDPDLPTIRIILPDPPPIEEIPGNGYSPKGQYFTREVMPERLKFLERKFKDLEAIYAELTENRDKYQEELAWIKLQWYYRLHGKWVLINGVPTYLDGWHWFYLNYWHLDVGLPRYTYRDYLFFHFARYAYTDTLTFKKLDVNGVAIQNSLGYYDFIDIVNRICFGFIYAKYRREGATYKAGCINYEIISRTVEANGGIQSRDDKDAKKVFMDKVVKPWKKLPFFFKPYYDNPSSPKSSLNFDKIGSTKGGGAFVDTGLLSRLDYEVGSEGAYDSQKLHVHHDDETGKNKLNDVWKRHLITKECLSQKGGRLIHGFSIKTSTVGEMTKGGGRMFKFMCKMSDWRHRNKNGQTVSGLYICFIPTYIGMENDKFGNPLIEKSREWILNERQGYLDKGDIAGWSEKVRQFPIIFRECFTSQATATGFNVYILEKRVGELNFKESETKSVNFEWSNGHGSDVIMKETKGGRWQVSAELDPRFTNKKVKDSGIINGKWEEFWRPFDPYKFTASADAFKFNTVEGVRFSYGAGAVLLNLNQDIDPADKPSDQWETFKFVCTYKNRPPTSDEFSEDMLLQSIYYGAPCYPERDVPYVENYFIKHGYYGYLIFARDMLTGHFRATPGFNSRSQSKQELFNATRNYIELRGLQEKHLDLLNEWKDIPGIEYMTEYDLMTAAGGALMGMIFNTPSYNLKSSGNTRSAKVFQKKNIRKRK